MTRHRCGDVSTNTSSSKRPKMQKYHNNKQPRTEKNNASQRRDMILRFFLRPEIGQMSPHFGAISLSHTVNLEKRERFRWRKFKKSSGDGALKLQISVPCRGRTRPEHHIYHPGRNDYKTNKNMNSFEHFLSQ